MHELPTPFMINHSTLKARDTRNKHIALYIPLQNCMVLQEVMFMALNAMTIYLKGQRHGIIFWNIIPKALRHLHTTQNNFLSLRP